MALTLEYIAQLVDGQLHATAAQGATEITGAAILRDAGAGDITLCESSEFTRQLADTSASAVLLPEGLSAEGLPYICVSNVGEAFTRIIYNFRPPRSQRNVGLSSQAIISRFAKCAGDVQVHAGAVIGDDVQIAEGCVVHSGAQIMAGCKIGRNVTIFPGAVLYENTVVGDDCIIHAGAVLGAYGFGYDTVDGRHQLSAQLGYVELHDQVEVGACTTIDRGTYGPTVIGEGTKLDNQVMIAHNCRLGRPNIICSQVGIAGSTTTGDYVVMAGQVGVRDHVHIGEGATLAAKAGISSSVPDGETYLGIPAAPIKQQKGRFAAWHKLPEMRKEFRKLQRQVEQLEAQLSTNKAA